MNSILIYQGAIYPWQCDYMGHLNVKFYTEIFDQAIWILFSHIGLTTEYMKRENKGMVALETRGKYFHEIFAGDTIFVKSRIEDRKNKTLTVKHELFKHHHPQVMAELVVIGLHIDLSLRKGHPLPEWIKIELD